MSLKRPMPPSVYHSTAYHNDYSATVDNNCASTINPRRRIKDAPQPFRGPFHDGMAFPLAQAIPAMFTEYDLDVDGLLPRALCPKVYDQVQKLVSDMSVEAQYAVWMWHEIREDSGRVTWHPHFELPFSRRVVVKEEKALPIVAG
jgi:hypothetical protein